ncbi:phosphopantothenoylcysteine decarboxylase [Tundrisphaera sp. TA3]|uniref:phosphopantothenoylcysteine decarboxylase domain-containing protein n=1 Tax=Tundrisphaera sp. TA3 TaxID=3435775 RepID=UPI003EBFA187
MIHVVVTAGGTVAPIDDVRALANASTGRFGARIAETALRRGAIVHYLHAPGALLPFARDARFDLDAADPAAELARLAALREAWAGVRDRCHLAPLRVGTVDEYARTLERLLKDHPIDAAFLAMAASDYAPEPVAGKLSSDAESLTIRCVRQPKVIQQVRDWSPSTFLVGFKLLSGVPTAELIRQAEIATRTNRADLTVANDLSTVRSGRHAIHLVQPGRPVATVEPPDDIAEALVDRVFEALPRPR